MPASTEKKRNRGVRKPGDDRAHAHGDAERNGDHQGQHRADGDAQEARTDVPISVPSLMPWTGLDHRSMREQAGVDVEVRDQDRPQDEQDCKGAQNQSAEESRCRITSSPDCGNRLADHPGGRRRHLRRDSLSG